MDSVHNVIFLKKIPIKSLCREVPKPKDRALNEKFKAHFDNINIPLGIPTLNGAL